MSSGKSRIGGATISEAVFVPPVHTSVNELMGAIEKFVHNDTEYFPEPLRIALVRYQFKTVHPFLPAPARWMRVTARSRFRCV